MRPFEGFAKGTKSLPVPSPLLGSLLAEIDDIAELKCTLRFLWYASQVAGSPKWVSEAALLADGVLNQALGSSGAIRSGLDAAVARGTLVTGGGRFLLHTEENQRAAAQAAPVREELREPVAAKASNVYTLYETNIGMLTPMVADQLRDAEETYPLEWIEAAMREATKRNVRNWRYISTILERWATEGPGGGTSTDGKRRTDKRGEPRRDTQTASAAEYLRQKRTTR